MKKILTTYNLPLITKPGFTLIEIIVALGLAALILPALAYVFSFAVTTSSQGGKYSQAYALAQENMEAIYYLKDGWAWTASDPVNTNSTEYYQPIKNSDGTWTLGSKVTPSEDANGFTKTIQIEPVYRNASDEIDSSGAENWETRKIISKVVWKMNSSTPNEEVSISSYVANN